MPRPAARKNRLVPKNSTDPIHQDALQSNEGIYEVDSRLRTKTTSARRERMIDGRQKIDQTGSHEPPSKERSQVFSSSQLSDAPAPTSETKQQNKDRTPIAPQGHEQAVESSPTGERPTTGSRPPSRARGYSASMSLASRKGDTSSRIPGTPAFESSILSNFRRRPRQPSILQMMQADDESSDLGDDDDFLGDMTPQDESTPVNRPRGKSSIFKPAPASPYEQLSPTINASRRRSSDAEELQIPQSPLGIVEDALTASTISEKVNNESSAPSVPQQPLVPQEEISHTTTPPMSSSPQLSYAAAPLPNAESSPRGTAEHAWEPTVQMAEEANEQRTALTTEIIQQKLLPRRRQRKRIHATDFEFPSDESDGDHPDLDDELSYMPSGRKPSRSRVTHKAYLKPLTTQGKSKLASQGNRKRNRTNRSLDVSNNKDFAAKRGLSRRPVLRERVDSRSDINLDKENQATDSSSPLSSLDPDALDSDTSRFDPTSGGKFASEELQMQSRKFAEVDQWQMEFEDVTPSASQASQASPVG